ncbi:MAG: hypothetical protein IPG50_01750 [Myxococcales bacterium]|nr:hypothetical protein [Myxococcales bacterium]
MRRAAQVLSVGAIAALLPWGCTVSGDAAVVVLPTVVFPRGILDQVTRLSLSVADSASGVTCDPDLGLTTGDLSQPVLAQDLASEGCASGVRFCGELQVRRAQNPYVFAARAEDGAGKLLAAGCSSATIDDARVDLTIQMRRFLEPAICGNGKLEPTELCDPPGKPDTSVCDASCKTLDVLLSGGKGTPGTTADGKAGDKERPIAVWPAAADKAGKFLALFTDKTPATREITMRVRGDAFGRYGSQGADVADFSFFMPHTPGAAFPPAEQPANQSAPAAVAVGERTWIAFEDDTDGNIDIRLRSIDSTLTAEQPTAALRVNGVGTSGESGDQSLPAIAVNSQGILFVAWQDDRDGSIQGRTYNPSDGTRGATRLLSTSGTANKLVRVVGRGTGFVATWESGTDAKFAQLSPDGTPTAEQKLNGAARTGPVSHPDIAALPDGRFAIVFSDRGDIFVQRFGADAKAVSGDQDARVNAVAVDGDQYAPAVAALPASAGFALAWIDGASGDVRAAYLGPSTGFLFNPVDAQGAEFVASATPGRRRANPAIAVGGVPPSSFVAVVWEDTTADAKAGIYGRRLPTSGGL